MNIVSIGNFGTGWDGSICDEEHIAKALEEQGHFVRRIQRGDTLQNIHHHHEGWDFILVAQWDGYPDTLLGEGVEMPWMDAMRTNFSVCWQHLEKCDCKPPKIIYWAFDYQADGQEWHERLVVGADLYLSKRIADSKYPNWRWLSQDFAPWFMGRHNEKPERDIDVLFTGSYLPWAEERNQTLKAVDEKFDLAIYSVTPDQWIEQGFKNVNGPVMDTAYTALVARAKINLSIDHTLEAGYWSDRNSQAMACGGFVLTRYIPPMEAVFKDRVAYFYGIEDCLKKLEYYLENEGERKIIGSRGYIYAQHYLMAKHRVKDLVTIVESVL